MTLTTQLTRIDRIATAIGLRTSEGRAAAERESRGAAPSPSLTLRSFRNATNHLSPRRRHSGEAAMTMYRVSDRLHSGRTVQVPGHEIASIVSTWLAELGAFSPLVDDLARAACVGDWAAACALGDQLSVDVTAAAAAA